MTTLTGTAVYRVLTDDADQAIDQADHWLSQLLNWQDPARGEDYDIDQATVTQDGSVNSEPVYLVRVPVTYTDRTDADLHAYLEPAQPVAA